MLRQEKDQGEVIEKVGCTLCLQSLPRGCDQGPFPHLYPLQSTGPTSPYSIPSRLDSMGWETVHLFARAVILALLSLCWNS